MGLESAFERALNGDRRNTRRVVCALCLRCVGSRTETVEALSVQFCTAAVHLARSSRSK
jgi:hypothetical protein